MRFGILGPTRAWDSGGREVAVGGPRQRALLARLLVDLRVVGTGTLIDDLYGDQPPAGAANALQSQVSRLRKTLPDAALVEFHPSGYRLAADPEDVDAHRFGHLAGRGRQALAAGDHARAAELLREALAQWRGAPLADVTGAPFAAARIARLEEQRLAATADRIEADLATGPPGPLVPELQELVAAHPLRERLRGQLMRALYAGGRQAEALAVFEDARRRLAGELGVDPSEELAAVHRAVLRHAPDLAAPARAGAPAPPERRLPAPLSSFLGRDDELRRVGKLLADGRLVTITGPGGAGKTRLAVAAAERYEGEVCLVELAPLGAAGDVPRAVLAALGLRDAGLRALADHPRPATERLVAALAGRASLLVLDNCEHVIAEAARLVDRLLRACPQLRVLATSREPFGLTGEALCPLSGLPLPPPDAEAAAARGYASVQLFADRAMDVSPRFTVDRGNLDAVLRICRALDGLPLGIELAAARLRSLPVAEVAARIDDRFALLSRGSRTAQPRHRTLRAVVEWSWDLLDGSEQRLARRFTVFAGGADLRAIEAVTGLSDVLEVLAGLVDKSFIEVDGSRYRMLETVRAFGAERLAAAGETGRFRAAHAAYFLDLAWAADPHLRRAEQVEWLGRLDPERENFHAGLRSALDGGDLGTALELVAALSSYWWLRGLRTEAAGCAGKVLDQLGSQPPPGRYEEYALCLLTAAMGGTADPARLPAMESPAWIMRRLAGPPRQPVIFVLSALAGGPPGDGQDAGVLAEQQRLLDADPWSRALTPLGLGYIRLWAGELAGAEPAFVEALGAYRALGERWGMTSALAALAEVAQRRGDRIQSVAMIDEALRLAAEIDAWPDISDLLRLRADGGIRAGEWDAAQADYEQALAAARRAGAPESVAGARHGLAEVARLRGDLTGARRLAEVALAECPAGWFLADQIRADIAGTLAAVREASAGGA